MKYLMTVLILITNAFATNFSDTVWTSETEYTVEQYTVINGMQVHVSNETYENDVLTKKTILWGDTINNMIVDSMMTEYGEGYHYVFTFRHGIVYTQIAYYHEIQEMNIDEDTRKVVKQKVKSNIVRYNSYEVRTFCNRIVELYYLDSVKVYSVYTEMYCNEKDTSESIERTPKYLNPIG